MMRDLGRNTITDAVLASVENTKDARMKEVSSSLIRHLHAFIRDVDLRQSEWEMAIDFLTRTGHACTLRRQEFILLSDVLGASMLVDLISNGQGEGATETTVLGPFYVPSVKTHAKGADISAGMNGEPLYFEGTVLDVAGNPQADAVVDVWHADGDGFYDVQKAGDIEAGRARFRTDENGRLSFWTIVPAYYPIPDDGPVGELLKAQSRHPYRPAHLHFMLAAKGHPTLVTHLFISGDRYLDSDVVFGVKDSLVVDLEHHKPGSAPDGSRHEVPFATASYDFHLGQHGSNP